MTATEDAPPAIDFQALTPRERKRLRLLAMRYRVRRDTTLRPVADVMFDLRSRHGLQLSMGQVIELLSEKGRPVIAAIEASQPAADDMSADLTHLAHLAAVVLNQHVNDNGLCAACPGVAFPCALAIVAEHNTALL